MKKTIINVLLITFGVFIGSVSSMFIARNRVVNAEKHYDKCFEELKSNNEIAIEAAVNLKICTNELVRRKEDCE